MRRKAPGRSSGGGLRTPRQPKGPRFPRFAADPSELKQTHEQPDIIEPEFQAPGQQPLTPEQIAAIKAKQNAHYTKPAGRARKPRP